ncbi:hypothetical protein [Kitasatospora sp. NPDC004272]
MAGTDGRGTSVLGAVLTCGPVALFDLWLLVEGAPLVPLPLFLVLSGAAIGVSVPDPGAPLSVRLYRAGVGALVVHALLVILLFAVFVLFPSSLW